jgi:hypothetical protein
LAEDLRESYGYDHTFTRWNDEVATSRENVVSLIHSVITSILEDDPAAEPDLGEDDLAVEPEKRRA